MSDDPFWIKALAAIIMGGAVVLVIAIVIGTIGAGVYYFDRKACSNRADEMRLEWKYKLIGGCFVELPSGRYVNLDNIRFTEQGKILVEP